MSGIRFRWIPCVLYMHIRETIIYEYVGSGYFQVNVVHTEPCWVLATDQYLPMFSFSLFVLSFLSWTCYKHILLSFLLSVCVMRLCVLKEAIPNAKFTLLYQTDNILKHTTWHLLVINWFVVKLEQDVMFRNICF